MTEPPFSVKPAYTLDETARLLGVSRATVNRWIRSGDLRVSRLGWRTVRVTHDAINDLLRARETTGGMALPQRKG
jgi:excisionase family DNA binding protein